MPVPLLSEHDPELFQQLIEVDDLSIDRADVRINLRKPCTWEGPCDHQWSATPRNRVERAAGCHYCFGNKAVLAGFNDLASQRPDVAVSWSPRNDIRPDEVRVYSSREVLWVCPQYGHDYLARVASRSVKGAACQCGLCSGRRLLAGFNDLGTKRPDLAAEVSPNSPIQAHEVTVGSEKFLLWVCSRFGHDYSAQPKRRAKRGDGCAVCAGRQVLEGFNDVASHSPHLVPEWSEENDKKPWEVSYGSDRRVWWVCSTDSTHKWLAAVRNRTNPRILSGCPECAKKYRKGEDSLYEFVASEYSGNTVRNTKKVVGPLELDLWLPELKVAFEYNGEYWHSLPKAVERDARKSASCMDLGITLLVVPERDWLDRRAETEELVRETLKQAQSS